MSSNDIFTGLNYEQNKLKNARQNILINAQQNILKITRQDKLIIDQIIKNADI
jgi:hypothetical protein